MRFEQKSVATL